jgi:hypothetical protein
MDASWAEAKAEKRRVPLVEGVIRAEVKTACAHCDSQLADQVTAGAKLRGRSGRAEWRAEKALTSTEFQFPDGVSERERRRCTRRRAGGGGSVRVSYQDTCE